MKNFLKAIKDTKGATAIEYGLIAALIAVAAITAAELRKRRSIGFPFCPIPRRAEDAGRIGI